MKKIVLAVALLIGFSIVANAENLSIERVKISNSLENRNFDRRLFIKEAGRKVDLLAFLNSAYNTDDYVEEIFRQKSKIITINISTYGILEAGNAKTYHEVTSCMFIDRKTGCLINRESAEACVGEWIDGRKWKTDDGTVIDLAVKRKSILDRTTADAYLLRKENYGRCQMQ